MDHQQRQLAATSTFRTLHESGCFVLPNPWDVGSAVYLAHLGFKALTTTSAGFAYTLGLPDCASVIPRDAVLDHVRALARRATLPVNVDFQSGYADDPTGVEKNVGLCVATGAAGLSIEDATGDDASPLYERSLAIERVRAARTAIDASGTGAVLTARCEAFLVGAPDPLRTSIDRLVAFAEAGADCLFAPGARDPAAIGAIVRAVAPKPVNVLVSSPDRELTVARLAELGVRRVSVGSALARVAWRAFMLSARSLAESGSFDALGDAASFEELNRIFTR